MSSESLASQLHEADLRWHFALEDAGLGLWDWQIQTGHVFFSPQWTALLGYQQQDIGQHIQDYENLIHPDDLQGYQARMSAHLTHKNNLYISEHRLRCHDGSYRWFLDRGKIVERDSNNQPLRLIAVHTDITEQRRLQQLMADSERRFRAVFNSMFQFMVVLDRFGHMLEVNEAVCFRSGMSAPALIGLPFWEGNWWLSAADRMRVHSWIDQAARGQHIRQELDVVDKDQKIVRLDLSIKPVTNTEGEVIYLVPEGHDITELRYKDYALLKAEQSLQLTLKNAPIGLSIIDLSGQYLSVNQVLCTMLGYSEEELLTHTWMELTYADDVALDMGYLQGLLDGYCDHFTLEKRYICKDGTLLNCQVDMSVLRSNEGNPIHFISQIQDISQRKKYESSVNEAQRMTERLAHQANHDLLTGLPNRHAFDQLLPQLLVEARQQHINHWLIYIDLDHFKIINDSCGHAAGDKLIREISVLFRARVRGSDFIARLGGDEFAVILKDCPLSAAERVADNLIGAVRDYRLTYGNKTFTITLSIGIASIDGSIDDHTVIMAQADTACYAAKDKGRGRYQVYLADSQEIVQAHQHMDWARRLNRALEENDFELFLQKIVDSVGITIGFEVLLRMRDDNGQMISPNAFMPVAKRMGLTSRIDKWVIESVFKLKHQLIHAAELGNPLYLSVNLSAKSVGDPEFLDWLLALLDKHQLNSQQLCFEITETEQLQSTSIEDKLITTLRSRGYKIWLDDFGTGYNSFELLKRIRVDGLKIDSSVTRDVLEDPIDRALVEAAISICHALNIEMVAEGVETAHIHQALVDMGIHRLQGYLFHRAEQANHVRF